VAGGGSRAATNDPEFMKPGTRVDTKLREIFNGPMLLSCRSSAGNLCRYDRANAILEEDVKGLQTENSQLKKSCNVWVV
jgi:hypothetical protein